MKSPRRASFARLAAFGALVLVCSGCAQQVQRILPQPELPPRESHWVDTDDNWTLHVWHYPPVQLSDAKDPVILCHGLSHNNSYWDVASSVSLARHLQRSGYDVWNVSLRGTGQSTKPKLNQLKQLFRLNVSVFNPAGLVNRQPALLRMNWTVDDHIHYDLPAVIDYVRRTTGHRQVHWIGHSMGAMVMFAHLATGDPSAINSFVGVSGPMLLVRPGNDVYELMAQQADFVRIGNLAAGTNFRAVVGTLTGSLSNTKIDELFMNDRNVDTGVLHAFYYTCEEDISPGQLDQLIRYLKTGHFHSYDGKIDYTALVEKIETPTFQLVGQLDNMIDPGCAKVIHERLASADKRFRMFGTINGHAANYGHDDIILGRHAAADVFPEITAWLNDHPASQPTTQPTTTTRPSLLPRLPLLNEILPARKQ
ncbi:MAG: alpha/beta hydrolase [Phycisphaerae bacterium]|nr:alpha/beta hydrolase [Phycisphaerae bacterium]